MKLKGNFHTFTEFPLMSECRNVVVENPEQRLKQHERSLNTETSSPCWRLKRLMQPNFLQPNNCVRASLEHFLKKKKKILLYSPLEVGTCVATASRAISASSLTSMVGKQAAGGLLSVSVSLCYNPGLNSDHRLSSELS